MRAVSTACRFTLVAVLLSLYYGRSTIRYGSGVANARLTPDGTSKLSD